MPGTAGCWRSGWPGSAGTGTETYSQGYTYDPYGNRFQTANTTLGLPAVASTEINAATTISSLVKSPKFDLTTTYFFIAGIAGVNPKVATLGSVAFAKYAIQVALEYEFDAREVSLSPACELIHA